ncbi:MAG: hypothetical protein KatS3mg022_3642 [Armatimonadota bacterium]|nr:MAG: hypothetical protein KatS3mg022_3642 [Armatimonadota bacterium]
MASPFPGMDPYLEDKSIWNDVHHSMTTYIRNALQRQVRPRYSVLIEERVYVQEVSREIVPDVSVLQRAPRREEASGVAVLEETCDPPLVLHIEEQLHTEGVVHILDRTREMRLVTVIELLSPTNKEQGSKGWELYKRKQEEILRSDVHLVEIDLLRGGEYVLAPPYHRLVQEIGTSWHYLISISRADTPYDFLLYPRTVRDRLPRIPIPLAIGDRDAVLDLQAVLLQCYQDGAYEDVVDYRREPPPPPFSAEDSAWIEQLLRDTGRR